jgi:vacuolar-type H+-ATPase subunit E/Vma4
VSEPETKTDVAVKLREQILSEARGKAEETLSGARRKAADAEAQAAKSAGAVRDKMLGEAKKRAEWVRKTTLASIETMERREHLKGQEAVIKLVCNEALSGLKNLDRQRTARVLAALIVDAVGEMGGDSFFVRANASQHGMLTPEFLDGLEAEVAKRRGKKVSLSAGKAIESETVSGGVIVVSADCRQTVDNTFEGRLKRNMGALRVELARVLFGEGRPTND